MAIFWTPTNPAHVRSLKLELPRELAERLRARAIRDGRNLETIVLELLAERRT